MWVFSLAAIKFHSPEIFTFSVFNGQKVRFPSGATEVAPGAKCLNLTMALNARILILKSEGIRARTLFYNRNMHVRMCKLFH